MIQTWLLAVSVVSLVIPLEAVATPPGPGHYFDCAGTANGTSCASDDSGCVPATLDDLHCAKSLGQAFAKAIRAVIKCHQQSARATFEGSPVDDEFCEQGPNGG